jgi:hypothetical protein
MDGAAGGTGRALRRLPAVTNQVSSDFAAKLEKAMLNVRRPQVFGIMALRHPLVLHRLELVICGKNNVGDLAPLQIPLGRGGSPNSSRNASRSDMATPSGQ